MVSELETSLGPAAFCIWEGEGSTEGECPGLLVASLGLAPSHLTLLLFRSASSYLVGPAALRQLWGPGGSTDSCLDEGRGRALVLVLGPGHHAEVGGGEEAAECRRRRADGSVR